MMKKYIVPITEILNMDAVSFVCASTGGGRQGDIGAGGSGSDYADPNWDNQGNGGPTDTGDDNGGMNSTGKDGSDPWDEVDDEE